MHINHASEKEQYKSKESIVNDLLIFIFQPLTYGSFIKMNDF